MGSSVLNIFCKSMPLKYKLSLIESLSAFFMRLITLRRIKLHSFYFYIYIIKSKFKINIVTGAHERSGFGGR